jgi:hypothetical protein
MEGVIIETAAPIKIGVIFETDIGTGSGVGRQAAYVKTERIIAVNIIILSVF